MSSQESKAIFPGVSQSETNGGSTAFVRWVQQRLNQTLGLRLAVDGIAGPQTRSAIRSFQQRRGLVADGVVGPKTEAALRAAIGGQSSSLGKGSLQGRRIRPTATTATCEVLDRFEFDRDRVLPHHKAQITAIARRIITNQASGSSIQMVRIIGHTDARGSEEYNSGLGQRRAEQIRRHLVATLQRIKPGSEKNVSFDITSSGKTKPISDDAARNRRVEVCLPIVLSPIIITPRTCPPAITKATTFEQYVHLVDCAERSLSGFTPRTMLSLLRQLYFGDQPWSKRVPGARFWRDVIPCGQTLADPRPILDPIYTALRDSQVVADTDIGHLFTGLEAMVCPTPTVSLNVQIIGIPLPQALTKVEMPNEEFATWGGDLGSAAAQKVHDEQDKGIIHPLSHYFGGTGTLASDADLKGGIDSFAVRAALLGRPCGATRLVAMPPITMPISQLIEEYYLGGIPPLGTARAGRFACAAQTIGGTISGKKISNRSTLEPVVAERVFSFAFAFYKGVLNRGFDIIPRGPHLRVASLQMVRLFFDWLEARL
jgi:outer membrane protein OmpA-like peptidoglycan-associated protein